MKNLFLLIKPASGTCNMRCKYCFYYDVMDHWKTNNHSFMTIETLETMVKRAFEEHHESVTFMFQGGEPTLIGLSYYETLIRFVLKYNQNNITTYYTIQTNGTTLNDEWASFFHKHNFLVGISIDGPKELHNMHRLDHKLAESFSATLQGLHHLQQHKVDYNILSVVTNESTKETKELYQFLTTLKTPFIQFIPCLDPLEIKKEKSHLSPENYSKFLKEIFDLWEQDFHNDRRISIRYFDDLIKIILGYYPDTCTLMGHCTTHIVIEADGSTYPCDFYVLDELQTGNIHTSSYSDIVRSKKAIKFLKESNTTHPDCMQCKYFNLCKGGCKRNHFNPNQSVNQKTKFCSSYLSFFDYAYDRLVVIAKQIQKELRQ